MTVIDTPLFTEATWETRRRVRTTDPASSLEAAAGVNASASQLAVLRVLAATRQPIADHEIHASIENRPAEFAGGVHFSPSRIRTARSELAEQRYVELVDGAMIDTPYRVKGARAWRITTAGRLYLMDNA